MLLKQSNLSNKDVDAILKKHCDKFDVRNATMDDLGNAETTIEVKIKKNHTDHLLKDLKAAKGSKKVMLFSHTGELSE